MGGERCITCPTKGDVLSTYHSDNVLNTQYTKEIVLSKTWIITAVELRTIYSVHYGLYIYSVPTQPIPVC